jgi:hypothetical protein
MGHVDAKMVSFKEVPIERVESLWPLMQGLWKEIQARPPATLDWKPEDVMLQLVQGRSRLALIYQEDQDIGYIIYRIVRHELSAKPTLQIWLGGLFPESRRGIEELKVIMAAIVSWCQGEFPMALEILSRRRGWERVLKNILNFHYSVYRAEAPA